MKRLYVGCRVRITGCQFPQKSAHLVGRAGRVIGSRDSTSGFAWEVAIDGLGEIRPYDGRRYAFLPEHLEPVADPGHQIVSWSECLWLPEGMPA